MGNDVKCQLGESEEEIIERVISSLPFKDIEISLLYEELNKRIIRNERLSAHSSKTPVVSIPKITMSFNMVEINSYLTEKLSKAENPYFNIHMTYFNNILLMDNSVLTLFTILIGICKGEKDEKVKYLSKLYDEANLLIDKDLFKFYLKEVIKANSTTCITSFQTFFGDNSSSKRLSEVYNDFRRKKLCDFILTNYDKAFNDVFKDKDIPLTDSLVIDEKLNSTFIGKLFDLIFPSLKGDFIRNWLSEEYERDIGPSFMGGGCCSTSNDY